MGVTNDFDDISDSANEGEDLTPLQLLLERENALTEGKGVERLLKAAARFGAEEIVQALLEAGAQDKSSRAQAKQDKVNAMFSEILDKTLVKAKGKRKPPANP